MRQHCSICTKCPLAISSANSIQEDIHYYPSLQKKQHMGQDSMFLTQKYSGSVLRGVCQKRLQSSQPPPQPAVTAPLSDGLHQILQGSVIQSLVWLSERRQKVVEAMLSCDLRGWAPFQKLQACKMPPGARCYY